MGLKNTVGAISTGLVSLVRTRVEIFGLELAEEKTRLVKVLGLAFAALLFLALGLLVLSILVAVMVWPTENRYLALGALAALYGLIGLFLLLRLRRHLVLGPAPFAATVQELGRDADMLAASRRMQDDSDEDDDPPRAAAPRRR
ncbi:phage holin family protein [Orrella sp. JC864]|uniref:phage holin family protein n=1 Tax=Orrella sp. JC864 TaxID=3120298 RepID=UPI0030093BD2